MFDPRSRPARRLASLLALSVVAGLLFAAQASAHIYWSSYQDGVGRANDDGTEATAGLVPTTTTSGVAANESHLYWTDFGGKEIGRANLDGTGVEPGFITGLEYPTTIVVDGEHIYWDEYGLGAIGRANLDGTGVEREFIPNVNTYFGLTVAGGYLYWSDDLSDTIGRARTDGTGVEPEFVHLPSLSYGVIARGGYLYWATPANNEIGRARLDGSEVEQGFITGLENPEAMTIDAGHLYFVSYPNNGGSSIGRSELDGSDVQAEFITGQEDVFGLAVDPSRPTVANTASAGFTLGDGTLGDTATIAGGSSPTGKLTFRLYGPGDPACSAAPLLTATAKVAEAGTFTAPSYTPTEAGAYRWTASYSGDVGNLAVASACGEPTATSVVAARPAPKAAPPAAPRTGFSTTLLRSRDKKKGVAKLLVTVEAAGTIKVSGPGIKTQTLAATGPGAYRLPVIPRGSYAQRLTRRHRGFTDLSVSFTPTGTETPGVASLRVRLARAALPKARKSALSPEG